MANGPFAVELSETREVAGAPTTLVRPDAGASAVRALRTLGGAAVDVFEGRRIENLKTQTENIVNDEVDEVLSVNAPHLQEDFKSLDNLAQARNQGRITRDAFFARVDARVSALKRNNPGFEDAIDARVRQVLGQDPRQALLASALRQEEERNAQEELIVNTMIRENAAAFDEEGNFDRQATLEKAPKFFRNRQRMEEMERQLNELNKRGGGSRGSSTALSAQELPIVENIEELLAEQYHLFVPDNLLRLAVQVEKGSPDEIQQLMQGARVARFNLEQTLVNQINQNPNLSPAAVKRLQERVSIMIAPLDNVLKDPDVGVLKATGNYLKAVENNAKISFAESAPLLFSLMTNLGDAAGAEIAKDVLLRGSPQILGDAREQFRNYAQGISAPQLLTRVGQEAEGQTNAANLPAAERRQVAAEKHRQAVKTLENFDLDDPQLEKWGRLATMDQVSFSEIENDFDQLTRFVDDYFRPNNFEKLERLDKQAPEIAQGVTENLVSGLQSQFLLAASSVRTGLTGAPQAGPTERIGGRAVRAPLRSFEGEIAIEPSSGEFRLRMGDGKNSVFLTARDFGLTREAGINEEVPVFGIAFGDRSRVPIAVDKLLDAGVDPQAIRQLVNDFNPRDTFILLRQMNQATERLHRLTRLGTVQDKRSLFEIRNALGKAIGLEETQEEEGFPTQVTELTDTSEEFPINPNVPRDRLPTGVGELQPERFD